MTSGDFPPPPDSPPPPGEPTAPRKKRRFGCLRIFLILTGLLIVATVAGYFLVRNGVISASAISAQLSGVGSVTVINTTDVDLRIELEELDNPDGFFDSSNLGPLEIGGFGGVEPAAYVVRFDTGVDCSISLDRGSDYQFAVATAGIAVWVDGEDVSDPDDLDILTSRWCGR